MYERAADLHDRPARRGGAALSVLIARGDRQALAEFYELWFDRAYGLARALTGRDEATCLDVVQESMLRVVRFIGPMKTDADVERWMVRVVHTTALDLLRRERRRTTREHRAASHEVAEADRALAERIDWLQNQLTALPADDRWLLRLRFALGRSLEVTGALAGMSGDAAHGRIRRALARLRANARESEHE